MLGFDDLATTGAARDALHQLRVATRVTGGATERHSLRCRHLAADIARVRGGRIDDEVLTIAAILHDIGLYPTASRGGVYTRRRRRLCT
jgi:HD superfamily phosphodiesterase